MKLSSVILMIVVSVNLVGCLSTNPSESDAKEAVNEYFMNHFKEYIDSGDFVVESVKKTDGKEMERMGVKMYEMKIDVTWRLPKGYNCDRAHYKTVSAAPFCGGRSESQNNTLIKPGFSHTEYMMVHFEKSEQGWHGKAGG